MCYLTLKDKTLKEETEGFWVLFTRVMKCQWGVEIEFYNDIKIMGDWNWDWRPTKVFSLNKSRLLLNSGTSDQFLYTKKYVENYLSFFSFSPSFTTFSLPASSSSLPS